MLKRVLPWILKLSLSGFLIWYVIGKVDLAAAWDQAKGLDLRMLGLAFLVVFFQISIAAERWLRVIRAIGGILSRRLAFEYLYTGLFFNLALPGMVGGDALRIWKSHKAGLSFPMAFNSVMLERIVTVLGLVFLVTALEPLLMSRLGDDPAIYIFPVLSLGGLVGLAVLMFMDRLADRFNQWRVMRGLAHLAVDARSVFLRPGHAIRVLGLAVAGQMCLALMGYILAVGLSMDVTLVDCLVLIPPVILVMTLPISISGWGVREGAMVAAFSYIGVPGESTLVLSVVFGLVTMAAALPGGIFWLLSKDRAEDIPDLVEEAEEVEREEAAEDEAKP